MNSSEVSVEMSREKWDVVVHALEEEMAQLEPEGDWLGSYPGEDGAVAIGEVHSQIIQSLEED